MPSHQRGLHPPRPPDVLLSGDSSALFPSITSARRSWLEVTKGASITLDKYKIHDRGTAAHKTPSRRHEAPSPQGRGGDEGSWVTELAWLRPHPTPFPEGGATSFGDLYRDMVRGASWVSTHARNTLRL